MGTPSRITWYRSPIDREQLVALTRRRDAPGLAHAGSFLLIYLTTVSACLFFFLREMWIPMIGMCYIHSIFHGFMGMGAAVHELSHQTAFKTRWINALFYRLFAFLTWNSHIHFKESHWRHHQYTLYENLDKEAPRPPIPVTWYRVVGWFTFDFWQLKKMVWTNLNHAVGNTDVDFFFWCPLLKREHIKTKKLVAWARLLIVGHLLLLGVFIYFRLWVLIYCVNFGYFFATFLVHGCEIQQHSGLTTDAPDWRVVAYSADFGRFMSYLYWNMNYHTEHHMYAAVPFYNLPALHRLLQPDLPHPIRGYLRGLAHVYRCKKRQNENPDYRYVPEFPGTANPPRFA